MRLLLSARRRQVAAMLLLIVLASCSDSKNQVYIEKPVDDLYNKAMDSLVDEAFVVLGGPIQGDRGILHAISASSEEAVRRRLAQDNWRRTACC